MNKVLLPQTVKNLPTDSLRMFVVLAEMKSISATAQIISRSQPAVSLQLKKLEETLNCTLFRRNKSMFGLTRNGEVLLHYARQILDLNDRLIYELKQNPKQQSIRLGIPNDFIQQFWLDTLSSFNHQYPDIRFEIYEDLSINLISMLHHNQLDMALTLLPKKTGKYCIHAVEKQLFWVGQASLAERRPLPIISCFSGCSYRNNMEAALKKTAIPFKTVLTTNNFYTIYDAIERGLGIYALLTDKNLENYQHCTLPQLPELQPLYLGLHIKPVNLSETIKTLTDHLKISMQ
ncbi:MAG: hypothetical protein CR977_01490 [Gammaproteobacteria bacterium]|nr:MAG: hypothetical protein CR977_01490 [Gammaproteobacteria bacterium]